MRGSRVIRWTAPIAFLGVVTAIVLAARPGRSDERPAATSVARTVPAPAKQVRRYYLIQVGDTYGLVASRLGTTVDRLRALNPGVEPTALRVGQRIRVR